MSTGNQPDSMAIHSVFVSKIAMTRIGIGLLQGIVLYFLYRAAKEELWLTINPYVLLPGIWLSLFVPMIGITSLEVLNKKQISVWLTAISLITGLLAIYQVWCASGKLPTNYGVVFTYAIALYIAHSLVLAGAFDKQYIARYQTYFEVAWKLLIQLTFSLLFVGTLFALLFLGSDLFALVKLTFLNKLLQKSWFVIPASAFAFSCALHITDVKPAIIRGIRTLLLTLLSWILPIATLIVAGFLFSLLWTGLDVLWETQHATQLLLGTAIVLVLLINAAFQDGSLSTTRIMRISTRIAAYLLLPIVVIATYALGLRVSQYAWTVDRVLALALLFILGCYAVGYLWAACQRNTWLPSIAKVNIINALLALIVVLAMLSPLADPVRIAVNSQMHQLLAGKVQANQFDFPYLKSEGNRYGLSVLAQLKNISNRPDANLIREKATQILSNQLHQPISSKSMLLENITVWPKTAQLPESFVQHPWGKAKEKENFHSLPICLTQTNYHCDAYLQSNQKNGSKALLLVPKANGEPYFRGMTTLFVENTDGHWIIAGTLSHSPSMCQAFRAALESEQFQLIPSLRNDIQIAGQRIEVDSNINRSLNCPKDK